MDKLKRVKLKKESSLSPFLKAIALVVIGAFLFNTALIDFAWAGSKIKADGYLRPTAKGQYRETGGLEKALNIGSKLDPDEELTGPSPGTAATLLEYMHEKKIFSDNPKSSIDMAGQRGGKDSQRTIQRELRVLQDIGLVEGDRTGYYLAEWLRGVDIKEIIKENPELNLRIDIASPSEFEEGREHKLSLGNIAVRVRWILDAHPKIGALVDWIVERAKMWDHDEERTQLTRYHEASNSLAIDLSERSLRQMLKTINLNLSSEELQKLLCDLATVQLPFIERPLARLRIPQNPTDDPLHWHLANGIYLVPPGVLEIYGMPAPRAQLIEPWGRHIDDKSFADWIEAVDQFNPKLTIQIEQLDQHGQIAIRRILSTPGNILLHAEVIDYPNAIIRGIRHELYEWVVCHLASQGKATLSQAFSRIVECPDNVNMLVSQFVRGEGTPEAQAFRQHIASGKFSNDFWAQIIEPGSISEEEAEDFRRVWQRRLRSLKREHEEINQALRLIYTSIVPLIDSEINNLRPAIENALEMRRHSDRETNVVSDKVVGRYTDFKTSMAILKEETKAKYAKFKKILENTVETAVKEHKFSSPQALILYSELLLDHGGIVDLEDTLKVLQEKGILDKVIICAREPAEARILEELLAKEINSGRIILKEKKDLPTGVTDEVEEAKALIEFAEREGIKKENILSLIMGKAEEPEALKELSDKINVRIVMFSKTPSSQLYSMAEMITNIITGQEARPVDTKDVEDEFEEYKKSLQLLIFK